MKLFQNYDPDDLRKRWDKLITISRKRGPANLMASAIPACPPNLKESVFTRAVDLVLSDGVVEDAERQLLGQLEKAPRISDETSNRVI